MTYYATKQWMARVEILGESDLAGDLEAMTLVISARTPQACADVSS